jgi:hypothetical protein
MTAGGIAGGLNHATKRQSVMTAGGIAGGLNHATKQRAQAGGVSASERIPLWWRLVKL